MGVSRAGEDKLAWIGFRSVVHWDVRACDLDHCPPLLGEDCARGISVGGTNAPGKDPPPKITCPRSVDYIPAQPEKTTFQRMGMSDHGMESERVIFLKISQFTDVFGMLFFTFP